MTMNKKEFIELVYQYGASGTKTLDGLKDAQKEDVATAWAEFDENDTAEETDEKFGKYYESFLLDGKWYVNYNDKDLEGYYTGANSGLVDYEGKGICNSLDYAMSFDTEAEALKWCDDNKEEWPHGDLSVW